MFAKHSRRLAQHPWFNNILTGSRYFSATLVLTTLQRLLETSSGDSDGHPLGIFHNLRCIELVMLSSDDLDTWSFLVTCRIMGSNLHSCRGLDFEIDGTCLSNAFTPEIFLK